MRVREVICHKWYLSKWIMAITLYPFIFYNGYPTPYIRAHEWVHVAQIRKYGIAKFYILYVYYTLKYGYYKNPFEIEAYEDESV